MTGSMLFHVVGNFTLNLRMQNTLIHLQLVRLTSFELELNCPPTGHLEYDLEFLQSDVSSHNGLDIIRSRYQATHAYSNPGNICLYSCPQLWSSFVEHCIYTDRRPQASGKFSDAVILRLSGTLYIDIYRSRERPPKYQYK